jgi:hypothetical protein
MALHTDIPSRRQIERLLGAKGGDLVSIYLPTTPLTQRAQADRIAFKNLAARRTASPSSPIPAGCAASACRTGSARRSRSPIAST